MNNNSNNDSKNDSKNNPSVGPTPVHVHVPSPEFYFEVVDQKVLEKEQEIVQLREELAKLKEFMSGQRDERDAAIRSLTCVVDDIVAIFPSLNSTDTHNLEHRSTMATVKGHETANSIINFIDNFKNSPAVLRLLHREWLQIRIEDATYESNGSHGSTPQIMCRTKCSIIGFEPTVLNGVSDNPFSKLKNWMENIVIETIKFGLHQASPTAVWYADNYLANDGIKYLSNERHAKIWEYKKAFSSRLVNAVLTYIEFLLIQANR
jgi:hypothetical protein